MFLLLYLLPVFLSAASLLYVCYLLCWLPQALSVRDLFIKQLVQLHGLSVQKAQAIVERYHTPRVLMAAYQAEGSAGEKLLANIRYGSLNRLIGPVISRTIHQFYTKPLLS
jgi:crossover junction endonuclease MUS81